MEYFITDASGQIHKFDNWLEAIKFAVQQAKPNPGVPVNMSSSLHQYWVWADGVIYRLEDYCACDTCQFCDHPNGSATCPRYWETKHWEHYDTYTE